MKEQEAMIRSEVDNYIQQGMMQSIIISSIYGINK